MKKCKQCNEWKDESQFYLKGHTVYGKYYVNYSGQCKECILLNAKRKRMLKKEGKEKVNYSSYDITLKVSDTNYLDLKDKDNSNNYEWIINNLKRYGNCFIGERYLRFKKVFEKALSKEIIVKPYENGYVLKTG